MLPTALSRLYRPPTECHPFRYEGCGHHGEHHERPEGGPSPRLPRGTIDLLTQSENRSRAVTTRAETDRLIWHPLARRGRATGQRTYCPCFCVL
jgi:hypothetical protein